MNHQFEILGAVFNLPHPILQFSAIIAGLMLMLIVTYYGSKEELKVRLAFNPLLSPRQAHGAFHYMNNEGKQCTFYFLVDDEKKLHKPIPSTVVDAFDQFESLGYRAISMEVFVGPKPQVYLAQKFR